MHFNLKDAALAAVFASILVTTQAITKVTRSGRYLYNEDGSRFYIKGIAYQEQGTHLMSLLVVASIVHGFTPGAVVQSDDNSFGEPSTFIDPLALPDACSRDLPFLQQLGVNTIRVYSVNSSLNHDACMSTFSNAGIYAM